MARIAYHLPWEIARTLLELSLPEEVQHAQIFIPAPNLTVQAIKTAWTYPSGRVWDGYVARIHCDHGLSGVEALQRRWIFYPDGTPIPDEKILDWNPDMADPMYDDRPRFWAADGATFAYKLGRLIGAQDRAACPRESSPPTREEIEDFFNRVSGILPKIWGVDLPVDFRGEMKKSGGQVTLTGRWKGLLPNGFVPFRQIALAGYIDGFDGLHPHESAELTRKRLATEARTKRAQDNCVHDWTCPAGYDVGEPHSTGYPMGPEQCKKCGKTK